MSGFVNGYPQYKFNAKVYDVGSGYGIDGGRISKLDVRRDGHLVIQYDRGWSIEAITLEERRVLKPILEGFPEREHSHTRGADRAADARGQSDPEKTKG